MTSILDHFLAILDRLAAKDAALVAWGLTATFLNLTLIRALAEANRRFNAFVHELSRFNARFDGSDPPFEQAAPSLLPKENL